MTQEQIIDNEILNLLEKKVAGSKELILQHTTKSSRRLAMLSILDDDRKLLEEYKNIIRNEQYCSQYATDVVQLLRKYVKVADVEKKKYGEVMTPINLVNEMLDTLPSYVWSNKDLKWLDPCNGVGTFPSVIVERLMIGLKDVIFDDCERYRHIIENMLYVCDIQAKNMFLFHCAFDREDNHELNTYYGSFLDKGFDDHMKNAWGVEKFDIIIGNPPYNDGSNNKGSAHVLWDKFVVKSLTNILKYGGYLNFVHPSGWRNVDGGFKNVKDIMKEKEIHYLNMNNFAKGKEIFGVQTDYDFYLLKNIENTNIETKIININDETEYFDLKKIDFIPNCKISNVYNLVAKDDEEKVNVLNNCIYHIQKDYVSNEMCETYNLPCIYSIKKGGVPTFKYSSIDKGHFGISKVILSNGSAVNPIIDKNGQYGMTQFGFAIVDDENNLEDIKKALENERFIKDIMGFIGLGNKYNWKIISTLRKDFYKQFLND